MPQSFFRKNYANTEIHSFADSYAVRFLEEGNNHSLLALPYLALVRYKH